MIVVLDTETTGLLKEQDRIVELAAIEVDPRTGEHGAELHLFLDPEIEIPAGAVAVHGITNERVAQMPRFADVAERIVAFIAEKTVVMHRASFDVGMIEAELARCGLGTLADANVTIVDSIDICKTLVPGLRSYALNAVCKHLEIDLATRTLHGALVDVRLLSGVLLRLGPHYERLAQTRGPGIESRYPAFFEAMTALIARELEAGEGRSPEEAELRYQCTFTLGKVLARAELRAKTAVRTSLTDDETIFPEAIVKRGVRKMIAWKAVCEQYYPHADLAPHTTVSESTRVSCAKQHELDAAGSEIVAALPAALELHDGARLFIAARNLRTSLDTRSRTLENRLLTATTEGYIPQLVGVATSQWQSVAYRKVVESLGGLPDYERFTTASSTLSIRPSALTLCDTIYR